MASLKVLIEGYAREVDDGWVASSTATLIHSNGKMIIVDPGCNRPKLLQALGREGLSPGDIDFVILTHNHTDHTMLTGIFDNAKVLNTYEIYDGDHQVEHHNKVPGTELEIIPTPGHSIEHISIKVPTAEGTYIVGGDVFWWVDGEEQAIDIDREDQAHPEEANMKDLKASRKKLLKDADFIIPGHGKIVKVK